MYITYNTSIHILYTYTYIYIYIWSGEIGLMLNNLALTMGHQAYLLTSDWDLGTWPKTAKVRSYPQQVGDKKLGQELSFCVFGVK